MMSLDYSLVVAETKYDMKRSSVTIYAMYLFQKWFYITSPKTGQSRKNISFQICA
jgi:hypothetical protein